MYIYEINDLIFLIKSLLHQTTSFKLETTLPLPALNQISTSQFVQDQYQFYFNRIVRLYNYFAVIEKFNSTSMDLFFSNNSILTVPAYSFHILCPCLQCSCQPASSNFNELQLYYFVLRIFSCTNAVKQNKKNRNKAILKVNEKS